MSSYARANRRWEERNPEKVLDINARAEAMKMAQMQMDMNKQQQTMQVVALCTTISNNREKYLADAESPFAAKIVEKSDEIIHDFLAGLTKSEDPA